MRPELQPPSDEALARQAQAGELASFEELVHRHEAHVYGFLVNCARHEADARDLAQETFVAAYVKLRQFDPARSFKTWLFTIARRKWIDRCRAWRDPAKEPQIETVDVEDPATLLAHQEGERDLWELARRVLPDLQFQALWLRYAEDSGVRDIARVLGKTQTHVKVLLFRARTALGRELENAEERTVSRGERARSPTGKPFLRDRADQTDAPLVRANLGFSK